LVTLPKNLQKLLLFSPDQAEAAWLQSHIEEAYEGKYQVTLVDSLERLATMDLESMCHAILLDLRTEYAEACRAIQIIGDMNSAVALICLCRSHDQLQAFNKVIHLVDDYILADGLESVELPTRITHAIRRRKKEHELIHEQSLLHSLLVNIPDAIYFKDCNSRFTKVNEAMARSYGQGIGDIIGKTDFDLFTEEHARLASEDEKHIVETGESIIGKIEKETLSNGDIRWVSTTKVPLRNSLGKILGSMGISRNITDLKLAQDKLLQEQALLKTIVNHALAGIFVKNRSGHYLLVNKRHSDYLGVNSPEDVKGKTIFDFFTPETASLIDTIDKKIMDSGEGREGIIDHRVIEGRPEKWLLTSKVPLKGEKGDCEGLVGISIDVTQQIEYEKALKKAIQTNEETKLQLIESEKLKTVGRMAAGVAHEVKNPLNVVALGAEYLKRKIKEPPELVEIIDDMAAAIDRANGVIFELLDYSAPHEVNMQPTNLNEIIKQVLSLLRHNFNHAKVVIKLELDQDLPPIAAERSKIEQVFVNLFLNAISAMEKGGELFVQSYTHRMASTGSNVSSQMTERFRIGDQIVSVEVADSGNGIRDEDAHKLFDPFFSTKSTGDGTGLGLSVTRSIVEMHRGLITLENRSTVLGALARLSFPIIPSNHA